MAAIAPRLGAFLLAAALLHAGAAEEAQDAIRKAADALRDQKAGAFWAAFDPAMPGYNALQSTSSALLHQGPAESIIEIKTNEGDDHARTFALDWRMTITQSEGSSATTTRHQTVTCKLERRDGGWKIVQFAPLDLFQPSHAGEAWDVVSGAAAALADPPDDSPVSPAGFLRAFDPKMPDYEKLREGLAALAARGAIEPVVELIGNEGDDRVRHVEVDWTLRVVGVQSGIQQVGRQRHVKLRLEWEGNRWRITSVDPLAFFAP